jgi:hypothetical protein
LEDVARVRFQLPESRGDQDDSSSSQQSQCGCSRVSVLPHSQHQSWPHSK